MSHVCTFTTHLNMTFSTYLQVVVNYDVQKSFMGSKKMEDFLMPFDYVFEHLNF